MPRVVILNIDDFLWGDMDNIPDGLSTTFWFSVLVLLLVTLCKYYTNHRCRHVDLGNLILEFPIDICSIIITVICAGFIITNPRPAFFLIVISSIISVICCILRRESIIHSHYDNHWFRTCLFGFLDIAIACAWIYYVLRHISQ